MINCLAAPPPAETLTHDPLSFAVARIYDFPDGCWVEVAGLVDARVSRQYAWCFFKGLAQMIGLGFEIPPVVNTSCIDTQFWCTMEHWTSLVCLYIGGFDWTTPPPSVPPQTVPQPTSAECRAPLNHGPLLFSPRGYVLRVVDLELRSHCAERQP